MTDDTDDLFKENVHHIWGNGVGPTRSVPRIVHEIIHQDQASVIRQVPEVREFLSERERTGFRGFCGDPLTNKTINPPE